MDEAYDLSKLLNVSLEKLVTGENELPYLNPSLREIVEMLEPLDPDTIDRMKNVIQNCLEIKNPKLKERAKKTG